MIIGALFPQTHSITFLVQYLLVIMLFLAFLDIEFNPKGFQKSILWVLVANILVPFICYFALAPVDHTLALAAFMTGIAPTAIATPVIISFLQKRVEYVVATLLVTNITSAIVTPLALPFLIGEDVQISVWEILQPVLVVMFVPLILAYLVRRFSIRALLMFRKGKVLSFPLWLACLFIISGNASNFLRNESSNSGGTLVIIALVSLGICTINFGIGALLGGRQYWQEASQALGQKNLAFVIWIALTFINPLVAMGPTFYILYHHLYNSWSIYRFERQQKIARVSLAASEASQ